MPVIATAAATAAAEATAAASAAAKAAFGYNRANYMFDQGLRFARFNTGYSMAMAQTSQYREDISDLTELTVTKADTYHTVGTICFVLNFQLIMAGRLGVHGPAPPGWILGIYWTNICAALTFLVMFTWMAMHAGARATAGAAYMRTRSVRLPIPTPQMLDQARKTGNSFEKERIADMFRIPFAMPAAKESVENPETGDREAASDRRMPKWYHDEVAELRKDEGGAAPSPTSCPEHFELYRGLQEEWWGYDIYSRIGLTFWFSHWLTAASLYSMCHIFGELRCLWPAWTVVPCFVAAHYGILQLDIVRPKEGSFMPPIEKVIPFVPFLAVLGMSIDYSVMDPTPFWQGVVYTLSWICYSIQFLWALRLYDLARPRHRSKDAPEVPGVAWAPKEWPIPPAFENSVYLLSAPKYLEPGQTCLTQEMKAAKGSKGQSVPQKLARESQHAMLPWKLVRGAIITTCGMWVLIMFGRGFEQVNGERQLLIQEGRVERWPSHMQPWMSPWTRKGMRTEFCHAGGCDRRLSAEQGELAHVAQRLAAALGPLADALETNTPHALPVESMLTAPKKASVQFPEGLRPELLAAHEGSVAAFERAAGRGAVVDLKTSLATPFVLSGVAGLGHIVGASWNEAGLLLTASSGSLAECGPSPIEGVWSCHRSTATPLPAGLRAAVASRTASGFRAAAAFDGEETLVLLEAGADGVWTTAGEVHAPATEGRVMVLALTESHLIISLSDGLVLKRALSNGATSKVASPYASVAWHGACSMGGDRFAHLASGPELFLSGPL